MTNDTRLAFDIDHQEFAKALEKVGYIYFRDRAIIGNCENLPMLTNLRHLYIDDGPDDPHDSTTALWYERPA